VNEKTDSNHPRCPICGRFMYREMWPDPDTGKMRFVRWHCVKVSSDGEGGYEHD